MYTCPGDLRKRQTCAYVWDLGSNLTWPDNSTEDAYHLETISIQSEEALIDV